ncbi:hypothetical protein Dimus_018670 [Dionaea muscipula]
MEDGSNHRTATTQRRFSLSVDAEFKATEFRPLSVAAPHMRAFHLAWMSLFSCFFSTFSIPPLLAVIRTELHLTKSDIAAAGISSFLGAIFSRLLMGPTCDLVGPRLASASLSLLTAPVVLSVSFVSSARTFILLRFLIGFCLANFVSCQFWMSSMFSGVVVGRANAVAAGWANVGSGLAQLVMPLVYSSLLSCGFPASLAWRLAFILPAVFQASTAIAVLLCGEDSPISKEVLKSKGGGGGGGGMGMMKLLLHGLGNYKGWILALTYGYCFGVELTTENIIAAYFYDRFKVNIDTAGVIAASFGLANVSSRPTGGWVSDEMGERYGMRGRLWGLWVAQTVAGLLCVVLGRVNSLRGSIVVMCCFSLFVQAASGLTFGVVPFVSKRALGVISGMTGSGGTVGAVLTQLLFFSDSKISTQDGISLMGMMMILCTLPITLMYFPQWGGMFCSPSSSSSWWLRFKLSQQSDEANDNNYHLLE